MAVSCPAVGWTVLPGWTATVAGGLDSRLVYTIVAVDSRVSLGTVGCPLGTVGCPLGTVGCPPAGSPVHLGGLDFRLMDTMVVEDKTQLGSSECGAVQSGGNTQGKKIKRYLAVAWEGDNGHSLVGSYQMVT